MAGDPATRNRPLRTPFVAHWRVQVTLEAAALRHLDAVPTIIELAHGMGVARAHDRRLFVVLSELITNAIDHGVLALDSTLKHGPSGFERYLDLRGRRLAALDRGRVEIGLEFAARGARSELRIAVADSGAGFDFEAVLAALDAAVVAHGHGIPLVKGLCRSLEYAAPGNRVIAVYDLAAYRT
jgi:anti-sigma regulatory factor (Ser/Thr protein kinase)